ncbi:hypothetical protein Goshw_025742 [Gossypium schwendimanii]|uniref:RNase H type-1 domain-containing protein n=1 Tax=Gossypium schwendimanii TaxID=34291 RepID=A0A7J9LIC0_GOSSC|nr:hypothetical protein [Gossypium schwendimanii]
MTLDVTIVGTIKKRQYMCYVIICLLGMYGERWFLEEVSSNLKMGWLSLMWCLLSDAGYCGRLKTNEFSNILMPPIAIWMKINTDGSANSNGLTVSVVRDSHENWVILHGLEVVRSKSYSKVVVESDCLHTSDMIKDKLENISFDTHSKDTISMWFFSVCEVPACSKGR